jgi:4,4'-diaponeurosporenoate glycosyltransferase
MLCRKNEKRFEYPKVSVIIPARNEEHNISKILNSINYYSNLPYEVIVVNDSSTDKTREIALHLGAIVIDSKPLPEGWKGKPWACWQGAEFAKGDIFIFLDADTELEPNGLKAIIDTYLDLSEKNPNGIALSVAPYHKVEKLYEEFSALFNIIMAGSMNAFTPLKSNQPTGLFGQSLVVSRKNYFEIKGHESVKNIILENVFMARQFLFNNINLVCRGGKGALSFRMYSDGFKNLVNGWTKAFASGAGETSPSVLFMIILWISSGFIITIMLINSFFTESSILIWFALYLSYALQINWMLSRIGSFKLVTSLFFPIHLIFYVIVFSRSMYYQMTKKSINWKSREVKP